MIGGMRVAGWFFPGSGNAVAVRADNDEGEHEVVKRMPLFHRALPGSGATWAPGP